MKHNLTNPSKTTLWGKKYSKCSFFKIAKIQKVFFRSQVIVFLTICV